MKYPEDEELVQSLFYFIIVCVLFVIACAIDYLQTNLI